MYLYIVIGVSKNVYVLLFVPKIPLPPNFLQEEALADCLKVLSLFNKDPAPFCWTGDDIALFFEIGPGQGARNEVVQQQKRGLPLPQETKVYLVKPEEGEPDKFILGIVKALAVHEERPDWPGVKIQFFEMPTLGADPYTCRYKPVLPINTGSAHECSMCANLPTRTKTSNII